MNFENDPYIKVFEKALSKEICEEIMKVFEENLLLHQDGITMNGLDENVKITKEMCFNTHPLNIYDKILFDNLNTYLVKYAENNIYIESLLKNNIDDSGYQIQKYEMNKYFYKTHNDSSITIRNGKISNRIITFIWYLNDVLEGGETKFFSIPGSSQSKEQLYNTASESYTIKPKQGSLLFFPATWTYPHSGEMPISNDKYIITGWIYENISM